mmetsp:Transcript_6209/g.23433  ORF Transcript_6209/g.23433 Transcript_6209/m.23433 type:complete len:110 (-) Transcript_6209:1423-1752(-)
MSRVAQQTKDARTGLDFGPSSTKLVIPSSAKSKEEVEIQLQIAAKKELSKVVICTFMEPSIPVITTLCLFAVLIMLRESGTKPLNSCSQRRIPLVLQSHHTVQNLGQRL